MNTVKRDQLIFIYPYRSSFVAKDIELLNERYEVLEFHFPTYPKWKGLFFLLKQFFFLISRITKFDTIVCAFAGYHSIIPSFLSSISAKKNIIILAGYDCYSFPSINYGAFTKRVLGKVVAWSCRNASHLIVVHESMINSEYSYDQLSNKRQGIRYFVPNLKTSITPVYYGYDTSAFYRKKLERSKNSFVTLAAGISGSLFFRKGIDLIIEVAQRLPNCKFTIIGTSQPEHVHLPDNVEVLPPVPHNQVNDYLNRYEFYLQLSMAEGFPNALCEAMLAGCIPIGSGVFSIPFIIGDSGFILEKKDVNELAELCTKAISHPDKAELSKRASERIANNFPSLRRKQALINIIERL